VQFIECKLVKYQKPETVQAFKQML